MAKVEGPAGAPTRREAERKSLGLSCTGAAGVALFCVGGYFYWANYLPPPEAEPMLPSPNGYDACLAAVTQLPATTTASPLLHLQTATPGDLRATLAPQKATLDALRRGLRLPYRVPPAQAASGSTATIAVLGSYRDAARAFAGESRVAELGGRYGEAVQRALDAVELGSRVGRGGGANEVLLSLTCGAIGRQQAERGIRGLSAADARAAGRRLDTVLLQYPTLLEVLEETRRHDLRMLRDAFSGRFAAGGGTVTPKTLSLYPRAWSFRAMRDYFAAASAEAGKPYARRSTSPPPRETFTHIIAPVVERMSFDVRRERTQLGLLRLELALHEYRKTHGRDAPALNNLVPVQLPCLPEDQLSGQPLVYHPRTVGYQLYSLGPDGKDDGGKAVPQGRIEPDSPGDIPIAPAK